MIQGKRVLDVGCGSGFMSVRLAQKALEKIYRVSKPQGISVIAVPTLKFLWSRFDKHMGHLRRYDKVEVERKLERKGFHIESLRYWNTCSLPWIFIMRKILKKESSLSSLVKPSRLTNSIFNAIINIEKALRFPIGLSIIVRACVASRNTYHFKAKARQRTAYE